MNLDDIAIRVAKKLHELLLGYNYKTRKHLLFLFPNLHGLHGDKHNHKLPKFNYLLKTCRNPKGYTVGGLYGSNLVTVEVHSHQWPIPRTRHRELFDDVLCTVRHELEHATQNPKTHAYASHIETLKLTSVEYWNAYLKNPAEVQAHVAGLHAVSRYRRKPLRPLVKNYLHEALKYVWDKEHGNDHDAYIHAKELERDVEYLWMEYAYHKYPATRKEPNHHRGYPA